MPKNVFKNVSPLGDLDVPSLGRVVEAGETVTVTDEQVSEFAGQEAWEVQLTPAEIRAIEKEEKAAAAAEAPAVEPSDTEEQS